MKNLILIFVFATGILAFAGCNKSDDSPNLQGSFVLNGKTYNLSKGFIANYGANGTGSFDFDVTLASSSIDYNEANQDFNGIGDFIYLNLNTSSEEGLIDGIYNFSSDPNAFTIVPFSSIATNYNIETATGENFTIVDGSIDVKSDGNETEFTLNLTISDGSMLEGNFKGILRSI